MFEDYHLRVGEIFGDSKTSVAKQQRFDETEIGDAKVVSLTEVEPKQQGQSLRAIRAWRPNWASIASAQRTGQRRRSSRAPMCGQAPGADLLARRQGGREASSPKTPAGAKSLRHRSVRIIRDYGMFERREAPAVLSRGAQKAS